ncbi:JAB domain-containing protein [Sorangium sp. So ce394]|uniref:JAB domain-containing protein n=1 Tax=Sorangium sp. So ce394 TaxID=3133310 RepID=UPI003F5C2B06
MPRRCSAAPMSAPVQLSSGRRTPKAIAMTDSMRSRITMGFPLSSVGPRSPLAGPVASPARDGRPRRRAWIAALAAPTIASNERKVCRGGLLSGSMRATDVLRAALELGAVAFVMAHNHPSGDPAPSEDDVALTHAIEHAAHLIGVPLQDHVIVTPAGRFASVFRAASSR